MMLKDRSLVEVLQGEGIVLSVEFFPPKDEAGGEQILRAAGEIRAELDPDFVSITYGAGGGTRERTLKYARILKSAYGFRVMPHLTCVGSTRAELGEILRGYAAEGFSNIMALRGDPPQGAGSYEPTAGGCGYAVDLVRFIREAHTEFGIGVAGYPEVHPEARSAAADMRHLKEKVAAGGDFITTQLFYDNANFLRFVESCRTVGITVPIIPGLMPIRSAKQVRRFCRHIPQALEAALAAAEGDEAATRAVGVEWTYQQMVELMSAGVKAFHLYIMNRSGMALEVIRRLRAAGHLQR